jgi:DNA modification methylase
LTKWWVEQGDSSQVLKHMPDHTVDALITDPPAGIGFMGKEWDDFRRQRNPKDAGRDSVLGRLSRSAPEIGRCDRQHFIDWLAGILSECRRVMKPGAMGWVWALPRTSHWTATACEDAGLLVRDVKDAAFAASELREEFLGSLSGEQLRVLERLVEAAQPSLMSHWFGTGFPKSKALLKPAVEHWILVRAPGELRELRIDENKIGGMKRFNPPAGNKGTEPCPLMSAGNEEGRHTTGRWPANVALVHGPGCRVVGTRQVAGNGRQDKGVGLGYQGGDAERGAFGTPGHETVDQYDCQPDCPVRALDEQAGVRKSGKMPAGTRRRNYQGFRGAMPDVTKHDTIGDSGAASRFFYTAKSSTLERNAGLPEHLRNKHPTVKSIALMRHLVRLVAAPGDLVLDPFSGSGSSGVAAVLEGCRFVGVEQSEEYCEVARRRIAHHAATIPAHELVDAAGVPGHDAAAHHADHGLHESGQPAADLPTQRTEGESAAPGTGGAVDAREQHKSRREAPGSDH